MLLFKSIINHNWLCVCKIVIRIFPFSKLQYHVIIMAYSWWISLLVVLLSQFSHAYWPIKISFPELLFASRIFLNLKTYRTLHSGWLLHSHVQPWIPQWMSLNIYRWQHFNSIFCHMVLLNITIYCGSLHSFILIS